MNCREYDHFLCLPNASEVPFDGRSLEFDEDLTLTIRKLSRIQIKFLIIFNYLFVLPRNSFTSIFPFLSKSIAETSSSIYASFISPAPFSSLSIILITSANSFRLIKPKINLQYTKRFFFLRPLRVHKKKVLLYLNDYNRLN
jgi:hypothetical protein